VPAAPETALPVGERKRYGVVAVCNGEGIEAIYQELGADRLVQGGQTQNPSTNDFLDAFAHVNAEHIFVFPNNGNIFMAAQQAAELYRDATVHVLPSKNIGTGYVALSSANFEDDDPAAVEAEMLAAMKRVRAGYVSPSIRDAELNGIKIHNGDTIGIVDKTVVVADADRLTASVRLAEKLLADGAYMLTVFCGKDAQPEETQALQETLAERFPDAEVYPADGGQDIYPYIFVAE
jgi:dihydroxyacetone kinase-like predicted kinase